MEEMEVEDPFFCAMEEQVEDHVCGIISVDDKDALVSFMKNPGPICNPFYLRPSNLLRLICFCDAVKCGTALLEGEMGSRVSVNVRVFYGQFPLQIVARNLCLSLVDLFLRHGAQTDIRFDDEYVKEDIGLLPLNIALKAVSGDEYLMNWTPGQSIFKLIIILCLPELKEALDTNRLLAWSTKETEEVAYHYVKEGKLIELAVLLMVAREKVLGPITFQSKDGSDGSMTLYRCINNEFASLIDEEFKLMGKIKSRKLIRMRKEKMVVMRSTRLLLEVFERAGDAIEEYLQLRQHDVLREQVVKDVALRLVEAGFDLKPADSDLSDIDWDPTKMALEESGVPYRVFCGVCYPFSPQINNIIFPRKGMPGFDPTRSPCVTPGLSFVGRSIHTNQVSKSIFGSLYSKNVDVQVKKRTKAIEQYVPKFWSSEKWAYFALVIKRGMRRT